jgi:hypothetical protein
MNPLTEVFGDTPDVAPYIPTNLGEEQIKALKENLAAFGDISKLGGKYYDYMLGFMDKSIPGFSDILAMGGDLTKKMQGTASEFLSGQIPQDVINSVTRSSAFQNLQSGLMSGAMGMSNTARNLGLTSLDMINQGSKLQETAGNAAQRWAQIASGLVMNPASFFVSPSEQFGATMQNRLYQQQTKQLQNNLNASPNPVAKGVSDTIINLLGAYLGGLHGGGGKGGGGTAPSYSPSQYAGEQAIQPGNLFSGNAGGAPFQGADEFNAGAMSPFGQPGDPTSYNLSTGPTGGVDMWSSFQPSAGYNPFGFGGSFGPGFGSGYPSGASGNPVLFNQVPSGGAGFEDLVL